ncbi:hypothetical protein KBY97_00555 [Synechococcus sp. ATX 2A4]|nr:hypothetical protein [Synechococcus sp. ATX 2A4]MCP9883617.1 hypothetical protein [Synechococcus sp. ATX 2A4]
MNQEQLWVIGYESPSKRRGHKRAKLLEGYGVRADAHRAKRPGAETCAR